MYAKIVPFTVHRLDDGSVFELHRAYRRLEDKLAEVVSPDGREAYTPDEINFYFSGEDDRPMQIVDEGNQ